MSNPSKQAVPQVLICISLLLLCASLCHAWIIVSDTREQLYPSTSVAVDANAINHNVTTPTRFVSQLNEQHLPEAPGSQNAAVEGNSVVPLENDSNLLDFVDELELYEVQISRALALGRLSFKSSGFLFAGSIVLLGLSLNMQKDSKQAGHELHGWQSAPVVAAILGSAIIVAACVVGQ